MIGLSRMCNLCHKPRSQLGGRMTYVGPYKVWICGMCVNNKKNIKKKGDK